MFENSGAWFSLILLHYDNMIEADKSSTYRLYMNLVTASADKPFQATLPCAYRQAV